MRRCLLIAAFLLLAAPAVAVAQGRVTTTLSSKPDSVPVGEPWKVTLTINQPGRAPRSDLSPVIVLRDADGFETTFRAVATNTPGRYRATVTFPKAGQWTYLIRDGLSTTTPVVRSVVIKEPAPLVDRPDPVGPPELPIIFAGVLLLGAAGYALMRRHRQPPTGPAHPA
jgi:hypothetical protein